jgi:hypothetical protein
MPRGGHGRSGRKQQSAVARKLHGSRKRPRHKVPRTVGQPMTASDPPPGLSRQEREQWTYYAPLLAQEGRLTLKARGVLLKYCAGMAMVNMLRKAIGSRRPKDIEAREKNRRELRQWALALRLYENDLLLNPSSAIRAPGPEPAPPIPPGTPTSEFDKEFDDDATVN